MRLPKAPRVDQRRIASVAVIAVLVVAVLYPLWLVLGESMRAGPDGGGWTIHAYTSLFQGRMAKVMRTTAVIVGAASTLSLVFGLLLAWVIERVDIPGRFVAGLVPLGPLLIPPVVGAAAWVFLLSPRAGYLNTALRAATPIAGEQGPLDIYSLWGIVFVVTVYVVPYTYTVIYPALRAMPSSLEEAAHVAGATPLTTARTVTFGLLRPAMLGALILAFVLTIAHFTIPLMLGRGQVQVLTTEIYHQLRAYPPDRGAATALSMLVVAPSMLLLGLQYGLLRRRSYAVVGGRPTANRRVRTRCIRWAGAAFVWSYAIVAFVLPIGALILVSVSPYWNGRVDVDGLSLTHFDFLFNSYRGTWQSIYTSVRLAVIGATGCVILAFVISYLTVRGRGRTIRLLDFVATFPAGIPATILGVGFLLMFTRPPFLSLYNTLWAMLIAYLVIFLPFAVRPVSAAIRQVSPELEDAARMAGSTWSGTLLRISVPIALPSLVAAWILVFVILSREVAASVFLVSPRVRVLGVTIFDLWNNGEGGAVAGLSLLMVVVSLVFIVVAHFVSGLGSRRMRQSSRVSRTRAARGAPSTRRTAGVVTASTRD